MNFLENNNLKLIFNSNFNCYNNEGLNKGYLWIHNNKICNIRSTQFLRNNSIYYGVILEVNENSFNFINLAKFNSEEQNNVSKFDKRCLDYFN